MFQLISKSHDWLSQLTSGNAKSVMEIADAEVTASSYVTRVDYSAFLAPDIVCAILDGTRPTTLALDTLKKNVPPPIDWDKRRELLGFTT